MKSSILCCFLLLLYLPVKAQKSDTIPFRKFTKIIIKNTLSQSENFKKSGLALIESGDMIGNKDEQFGQLISGPVKIWYGEQFIYLITKDNEIILTSKHQDKSASTGFGGDKSLIDFEYHKGDNLEPEMLNNIQKILKLLPKDKVYYSE